MEYPPRLIPEAPQGFTRTLAQVNGQAVIRSSCDYCWLVITAATAETAWLEETAHREYCQAKKPSAAASNR